MQKYYRSHFTKKTVSLFIIISSFYHNLQAQFCYNKVLETQSKISQSFYIINNLDSIYFCIGLKDQVNNLSLTTLSGSGEIITEFNRIGDYNYEKLLIYKKSLLHIDGDRYLFVGRIVSSNRGADWIFEYSLLTNKLTPRIFIPKQSEEFIEVCRLLKVPESKNVLLVEHTIQFFGNVAYLQMLEFDQNFNEVRSNYISDSVKISNMPAFIFLNKSKEIEIIGERLASTDSGTIRTGLFCRKIDSNYNSISYITLETKEEFGIASGSFGLDEQNNYKISGHIYFQDSNSRVYDNKCAIFSINSNFTQILWKKILVNPAVNGTKRFLSIGTLNSSDNQFYTFGNINPDTHSFSSNIGTYVYKFNSFGDSIWMKFYIPLNFDSGTVMSQQINSAIVDQRNKLLLVGSATNTIDKIEHPWILKLDEEGCFVPNCNELVHSKDSNKEKLKPFSLAQTYISSNFINLISNIESSNLYEISIVDLSGRTKGILEFKPLNEAQYLINIPSDLTNGTYILKIQSASTKQTEKIVILR